MERIVCAAALYPDGLILCSARHHDHRMHSVAKSLDKPWHADRAIQGFINQNGEFRTRTEAWKIADAAKQIICRCGGDQINGGTLYSENLY